VSRLRRHGAANHGFDFQKPAYSAVRRAHVGRLARLLNEIRFQYAYANIRSSPAGQQPFTTVGDYPAERYQHQSHQRALYLPRSRIRKRLRRIGPEPGFQFKDTVTFSRRKAQRQARRRFQPHPIRDDALYNLNGYYVSRPTNSWTAVPKSIANLKNPSFLRRVGSGGQLQPPTQHLAWFIQDTWRPTAPVTVDFGLRYDRQFGSLTRA